MLYHLGAEDGAYGGVLTLLQIGVRVSDLHVLVALGPAPPDHVGVRVYASVLQAPLAQKIQKLSASAPDIKHGLAVPEEVEVSSLAVADKVLGAAEDILERVLGPPAPCSAVTAVVALDAPCHRLLEDLEG